MALGAVAAGFACKHPVATHKVCVMVKRDTFRFMAAVALTDRSVFIFCMGRLLFGIRLLLEADKSKAENC
jgi:hypothetical protein